jgi:hypothetical protein
MQLSLLQALCQQNFTIVNTAVNQMPMTATVALLTMASLGNAATN